MIRLKEIGHVLLRVLDMGRSVEFYSTLLGFEVMEQDPDHGGVFMALPGHAHTLDLFPAPAGPTHAAADPGRIGVHHVAFRVDGDAALTDAYWALVDADVEVVRAVDHVSQKSIYFHDPDGNLLEIY